MKKGYRLRYSNLDSDFYSLYAGFALFIIISAGIAYVLNFFYGTRAVIIELCVFAILYAVYVYFVFNCGIFLVGARIVCRGIFKEKEISLESITAIKVVHEFYYVTTSNSSRTIPEALYDKNGNPLFLMYFLKKTENEMNSKIWDSKHFGLNFSDCIIFQCVYDEKLLQYLISLNPNIERM